MDLSSLAAPDCPIAIVGLGYVGLPLAVEFGKRRPVVGFDIRPERIAELQSGRDSTLETTPEDLAAARHLTYSSDPQALRACRIFIVTVPTPVDEYKRPDLTPLIKASETVGKVLKPGDLVIYESTVYPGCTEEDCVPVLERHSGLRYIHADRRRADPGMPRNPERRADRRLAAPSASRSHAPAWEPVRTLRVPTASKSSERLPNTPTQQSENAFGTPPDDQNGFYCGYSPERINPGDREHRLTTIKKVTSGSTPEAAAIVDALYRQIVTAGTHQASSIRVAEAAKVIENTQRDLNIALMNELALIFDRLGIDTLEVLEAAGSKWNFLPFRPGLVGGHCIGVDPYYLTHKAVAIGYHPEVILAGRRINDRMGAHVAERVVKLMLARGIHVCGSRILVLGFAFKENCPDLRNTRVIDIVHALTDYSVAVDCYDPWIDVEEARREYGVDCLPEMPAPGTYDAIVLAVAHRDLLDIGAEAIRAFGKPNAILYDVKSVLAAEEIDGRL